MRKTLTSVLIFICSLFAIFNPAKARDIDDAKKTAQEVRKAIETKKYDALWENQTSEVYKTRSSKLSFINSLKMIAPHLEQVKRFKLMDASVAKAPADSGIKGSIYTFNYQASNASVAIVQRILIVKDADGKFRLAGLWTQPVPN